MNTKYGWYLICTLVIAMVSGIVAAMYQGLRPAIGAFVFISTLLPLVSAVMPMIVDGTKWLVFIFTGAWIVYAIKMAPSHYGQTIFIGAVLYTIICMMLLVIVTRAVYKEFDEHYKLKGGRTFAD